VLSPESGYYADVWLTLDELFADPATVAPLVATLADRLRPHEAVAVCGPLLGGAFLAQALATTLGARFYYTEPVIVSRDDTLFTANYRLPPALRRPVRGQAIAAVVPVETLQRSSFDLWEPSDCPLCQSGCSLEDPRERVLPIDRVDAPTSTGTPSTR